MGQEAMFEDSSQMSAFSVADYLQLAGMARRSLHLRVSNGQTAGTLVVQGGVPVWAQDERGTGPAAFHRLALLSSAQIACAPAEDWAGGTNLEGSLEQLLLDAARAEDEARKNQRMNLATSDAGKSLRPSRAVPRPERLSAARPPEGNKNMNEVKKPKTALTVLSALDALRGVARADDEGSVIELAGEMEAETLCAVATIVSHQMRSAAEELGLGEVQAWHVSLGKKSYYSATLPHGRFVAEGPLNKNAAGTLKRMADSCHGGGV